MRHIIIICSDTYSLSHDILYTFRISLQTVVTYWPELAVNTTWLWWPSLSRLILQVRSVGEHRKRINIFWYILINIQTACRRKRCSSYTSHTTFGFSCSYNASRECWNISFIGWFIPRTSEVAQIWTQYLVKKHFQEKNISVRPFLFLLWPPPYEFLNKSVRLRYVSDCIKKHT